MPEVKGKLTPKQARFVENYLIDLNATQAAIRAGYSQKAARSVASRMLTFANVAAAVAEGREKQTAKAGINRERLLAELEGMAFTRLEHFDVDAAGNVTPKADAPAHVAAGLVSVKRREWSDGEGGHTVEVEFKINGKFEPVKLAGRHLGIPGFSDRIEASNDTPETEVEVFTGLPPDEDDLGAGTA